MSEIKESAIRDPIWKHIYLPSSLYDATLSRDFIRLNSIKQLGPAYLVYPGATHTRFCHSLGVYHIAQKLLTILSSRGAEDWITKQGGLSFKAAALFHDLGHFPYAHSLKELPLDSHEKLTAALLLKEPICSLISKYGAIPEQCAAIIDNEIQTTDEETLFFRKLLSGVLDPDKIDYLNRDAYFCGVPYGVQDTDFILSKLIPHKTKGIILESNGILAVESILFSKYLMYRSVYWHKNVRIATAMMKKALYSVLLHNKINKEQLYSLDDNTLYDILNSVDFPELSSAQAVQQGQLYQIISEVPFDDKNPFHTKLEKLSFRQNAEAILADKIQCDIVDIVIDIPERISFESNLWIKNENVSFSESSTVFSPETVKAFTQNLRKIRCAVNRDILTTESKKISIKKIIAEFILLGYT